MSTIRGALLDPAQIGRFISVGAMGATLDLAVSTAIFVWTGVPAHLAKFVGAECAIVAMFVANDRWTFITADTRGWRHRLRRLAKSNLVRSGGLAIQVVVVYVLTRLPVAVSLGGIDMWPLLTMPIAIGCGFLLNYVGESLLTWRIHR